MIRPAVVEDAAAVAHVHRSSRAEAYAHLGPQREITVERWVELLSDGSRTWVWEQDGAVLGFASVAAALLAALYVLPGAQGRRIGTALLDFAVGHGARELWVYEDHPRARAFYAREGWVAEPETLTVDPDWSPPLAPALRYRYAR
ncbi:MAG: hypothetical protein QOF76_4365 [Solirubrobacteraceae bacterium]|nr:hypothetical protein [Solirubrobacteraceae bacterium]